MGPDTLKTFCTARKITNEMKRQPSEWEKIIANKTNVFLMFSNKSLFSCYYIKGTFYAKMGSIKDRNGVDLTEAENIKKRWQNTQKSYTKKTFRTPITMMV